MKLSIAIINYNTKGFLEMCLRSINKSVKPWEYEIIIIDNASNDDLITVISKESSTIKFSVNKQNVGFAKAYNQAIKEAKGEYILLLNPDVVLLPTTMTRCVEFLERHPEVSVVTCYVELVDSKIDPACHRGFPDPWTSFTYFIGLEKLFPKSRLFGRYHLGWLPLNTIHEIDTPSGCFYMIRKSVIDEVGLLDENYFLYYEEVDWSYRIKQKGWKIFFLPEVKIIHLE
jgi:GT2 family glycosyltransferase